MATALAQKRVVEAPVIPDRLYFKIGDAARICGVETYVLRFWETQFPQLKPGKSGTGQRLYRRRDVELALQIKQLVHGEGYTLVGARQALEQGPRRQEPQSTPSLADNNPGPGPDMKRDAASVISHVRSELREIARQLTLPEPVRRRAKVSSLSTPGSQLLFPS